MTIDQYHKKEKEYKRVRDFTIRYCRERLGYQNIDMAKAMKLSAKTVSNSYQKVKSEKGYEKLF